jgi:hypothetical protein
MKQIEEVRVLEVLELNNMKLTNSVKEVQHSLIEEPVTRIEKKILKEVKFIFENKVRIFGYSYKEAKKEIEEELELFFDRIRYLVDKEIREENND